MGGAVGGQRELSCMLRIVDTQHMRAYFECVHAYEDEDTCNTCGLTLNARMHLRRRIHSTHEGSL